MSARTSPRRKARKLATAMARANVAGLPESTWAACEACFDYRLLYKGLCLECYEPSLSMMREEA